MKKTLTLLVASSALTAAIGVPAWSATRLPADLGLRPSAALSEAGARVTPLLLASGDDDDDRRSAEGSRRGHDEDDDEDDDDCDDDCRGGARDPAPAGAVAPPPNGLFGTGAPPRVQVN